MTEKTTPAWAQPPSFDEFAGVDVMPASKRPSRRRRLVLVVVVVAIVGLLASIVSRGRPDDPAAELAELVSFTERANMVHVDATINVATSSDEGLGTTYNTKWRAEGDVRFPNEAHLLVHTGDRVFQRILIGDDLYERSAVAEENLYLNPWSRSTIDMSAPEGDPAETTDEQPTSGLRIEAWDLVSQAAAFGNELQRMRQVLARADEPTRVSRDAIRVELTVQKFLDAYFADLASDEEFLAVENLEGSVTFDLTSGPGGRLDRIVTKVDARSRADGAKPRAGWRSTSDVHFTAWGEPVEIAAPNMDPFPQTPIIDLERISGAPFTVLAPSAVAPDLKLMEASYFLPEDRGLEESDCDKVTLYYANPDEEQWSEEGRYANLRFLNLDITSTDCETDDSRTNDAYLEKRAGAPVAYSVGPYRGTIARYETHGAGRGAYIVLTVDGVEVFVDSTLSDDETMHALSGLAPFDPTTQPVASTPISD